MKNHKLKNEDRCSTAGAYGDTAIYADRRESSRTTALILNEPAEGITSGVIDQ